MLTGGSWCLWAEFGVCRQKLVLMGSSWRFQIFEIFQIEKVGAKFQNLKKVGALELRHRHKKLGLQK